MSHFADWVEMRKNETIEVPLPKRDKNATPKVPRPAYSTIAELLALGDDDSGNARDAESADLDRDEAIKLWSQDPEAFNDWMRRALTPQD